jgi:hypothetical protein
MRSAYLSILLLLSVSLFFDSAIAGQYGYWTTATLSEPRSLFGVASVGPYTLIVGGHDLNGDRSPVIDIYNYNTGTWTTRNPGLGTERRRRICGVTVKHLALFAGGELSGVKSNLINVFNSNTQEWTVATLSVGRDDMAATSIGKNMSFFICE